MATYVHINDTDEIQVRLAYSNAALLEKMNVHVVDEDPPHDDIELLERGFERRLRAFRPDVVGTSSYITGVNEVIKLCRAAKRWSPHVRTVVGGVHASRALCAVYRLLARVQCSRLRTA